MSESSFGALLGKYGQSVAGITAVRAAIGGLDAPTEFVLLDDLRAIVVSSVSPSALHPRRLLDAERMLLAGAPTAQADGHTSVRVQLPDDRMGALTVECQATPSQEVELVAIADQLGRQLRAEVDSPVEADFATRVLAQMRETVMVVDLEGHITWSNLSIVHLLGFTPQEMVGRLITDFMHPDDVGPAERAFDELQHAVSSYRRKIRLRDAGGQWVPVSISGSVQTGDPGIDGVILCLSNYENAASAEKTLQETRKVSTTILESLTDAVVATDHDGSIMIVNRAARQLFDIDPTKPISEVEWTDFPLLDERGASLTQADHPLKVRKEWPEAELTVITADSVRTVRATRSAVSTDFEHRGSVVTFHDVTQARSDARELHKRARLDQLTGLANRRYLQERLQALEISDKRPRLAALFVDIDNFKSVNDVHGHSVGDAVLKASAQRLSNQIRSIDIIARPGGDEFLVILVNPDNQEAAVAVAERIRATLSRAFDIDGLSLHLSASVGVAMHLEGPFDDGVIMQRADIALYAAKQRGRDRVEVFDQTLATVVEAEQEQRNMVRAALAEDRLAMHYQPIVDHHGAPVGLEALARIRDENGTLVGPAGFIAAIDDTSLIVQLDHAGFDKTCELASQLALSPRTEHIYVSSNFSPMTIAQPDFAERVAQSIKKWNTEPESVCIELTETAAFHANATCLTSLRQLHAIGVRIVLDDFGTGYSSLAHLRDLPLSTVKIDRSFTSALRVSRTERAIAAAIRSLAESLGFNVIAEGVETAEDRQAVIDIGVEAMQGWYFAKALSPEELMQSLWGELAAV